MQLYSEDLKVVKDASDLNSDDDDDDDNAAKIEGQDEKWLTHKEDMDEGLQKQMRKL